jgi:hypothetical protein
LPPVQEKVGRSSSIAIDAIGDEVKADLKNIFQSNVSK